MISRVALESLNLGVGHVHDDRQRASYEVKGRMHDTILARVLPGKASCRRGGRRVNRIDCDESA